MKSFDQSQFIILAAAIPAEISGLRRHIQARKKHSSPGFHYWTGQIAHRQLVLVQTGMGRTRAENAVAYILDRFSTALLVNFGFAGALAIDLRIGDLLVCNRLLNAETLDHPDELASSPHFREIACRLGTAPRFRSGASLTVPRLIANPQEKRSLAANFPAQIVEMEGYWIARLCQARQVPFLGLRSVSDTLEQRLPDARELIIHPWRLAQIPALLVNLRRAEQTLTQFLLTFLQASWTSGEPSRWFS